MKPGFYNATQMNPPARARGVFMSSPSTPSMVVRVLAVVVSAFALFVWLQTVIILSEMTGSDAAGNGMAQGFAAIGLILLWIVLAVLALLSFAKGEMPRWAALGGLILIPASGLASMASLDLLTSGPGCRRITGRSSFRRWRHR